MDEPRAKQVDDLLREFTSGHEGLLVGWCLIMETIEETDRRMLHRVSSPNLPNWARSGYLHDALNEAWEEEDTDQPGTD